MATFSLTNSATQEISNLISTKPMLISKAELLSLGSNIKLVGYDPILGLNSTIDRSFSPRLVKWVEPYEIKGTLKTLFYTEVNSELNIEKTDKIWKQDFNEHIENYKFVDGEVVRNV